MPTEAPKLLLEYSCHLICVGSGTAASLGWWVVGLETEKAPPNGISEPPGKVPLHTFYSLFILK